MSTLSILLVMIALSPQAAGDGSGGFIGVLVSEDAMNLEPSFEGRLVEVNVRIGDRVSRGQVIARLDSMELQQELARARAEAEGAIAERQEAATRLSMAEESHRRKEALPDAFSTEERRGAEEQTRLAQSRLDVSDWRVREKQARVSQLEDRLSRSRIESPFDGTVAIRFRDPGEAAGPGLPVVRIIGLQGLWVRFAVTPNVSATLHTGQPVEVAIPSLEIALAGSIQQVGSEVDAASGMIFCEASVDSGKPWDGPPLSGREVRVRISAR